MNQGSETLTPLKAHLLIFCATYFLFFFSVTCIFPLLLFPSEGLWTHTKESQGGNSHWRCSQQHTTKCHPCAPAGVALPLGHLEVTFSGVPVFVYLIKVS